MSDSETEERRSSGRSSTRFTFSGEKDDFDDTSAVSMALTSGERGRVPSTAVRDGLCSEVMGASHGAPNAANALATGGTRTSSLVSSVGLSGGTNPTSDVLILSGSLCGHSSSGKALLRAKLQTIQHEKTFVEADIAACKDEIKTVAKKIYCSCSSCRAPIRNCLPSGELGDGGGNGNMLLAAWASDLIHHLQVAGRLRLADEIKVLTNTCSTK